ncbi:hypothetical protein MycrhDRAFT_5492 [Mycolicibacterium rhodesiae JS60]|nr:hypothetical protein MycrhDRAFT_5492 [Mycolicibacterium rhodesiae JS60]
MSGCEYIWAHARDAKYILVDKAHAPDELNTEEPDGPNPFAEAVIEPWALFIGDDDGLIIQGELDDLVELVDLLHDRVHRVAEARR